MPISRASRLHGFVPNRKLPELHVQHSNSHDRQHQHQNLSRAVCVDEAFQRIHSAGCFDEMNGDRFVFLHVAPFDVRGGENGPETLLSSLTLRLRSQICASVRGCRIGSVNDAGTARLAGQRLSESMSPARSLFFLDT